MTETTFELADVERLAATLDAVDLDDTDRATLHAVFALAGRAAADERENEVSGFLLPAIRGGLMGSFQLDGTSGNPDYLEKYSFTFGKISITNLSDTSSGGDDLTGGAK